MSIAVDAAEDSLSIGYCLGEVSSSSIHGKDGKGEVSAAIHIPASMVKKFAGNSIVCVKAGLAARINIDSVKVWVRSTIDGDNLAEGIVIRNGNPKLLRGWNKVQLTTPVELKENSGELYIGYTYYQKSDVRGVSVVGKGNNGTSFVKINDSWVDLKDEGVLSIEGIITGENLPKYDLALNEVSMGSDLTISPKSYYARLNVTNKAVKSITGFDVIIKKDGSEIASVQCKEQIAPQETKNINITFNSAETLDPSEAIEFTITNLVEGTDQDMSNNSCLASFKFERNVLVEEFTTEQCPNCPRVAGYLHAALEEKAEYEKRVFAVCHHSAYRTDWLTQDCDEKLTWLFNDGGTTYAPAIMINRMPMFKPSYGTELSDNVFIPDSKMELVSYFDRELEKGADCTLNIQVSVNSDTTKVLLTINGQKNVAFNTENKMLTVYMIEDNIDARNQIGANGKFVHQHVIRAYNKTWGDEINWEGNSFSANYYFDINKGNPDATDPKLKDAWKTKDLQFVAFVNNYDSTDKLNCAIENSAHAWLIQSVTDSIESTDCGKEEVTEVARYTLGGQRISDMQKGINIVKYSDGTTRKVVVR